MLQISDPSDSGSGDVPDVSQSLRKGSSVSELVKNYDDSAGKRDRSESGDSAPLSKRKPASSPHQTIGEVKELIEDAVEGIESRLSLFLSKALHDFKENLLLKFDALNSRIEDLEEHMNAKDMELEKMSTDLQQTREEVKRLQERAEKAEMNSRIPCLVLSGRAMAPDNRRLAAPLLTSDGSAPRGTVSAGPRGPGGAPAGASGASGAVGGGRGGAGGIESEDINSLVVGAVRERFEGLDFNVTDIARAHRLPGPNHRVIVRFVQSGLGSVRDQLMSRRMELRKRNDLFINESLTEEKNRIYHSLLAAKKADKLYTVFTRWGHVYYKSEKFGTSSRVDMIDKLQQLGFSVRQ